jgi:hypothetical protein
MSCAHIRRDGIATCVTFGATISEFATARTGQRAIAVVPHEARNAVVA